MAGNDASSGGRSRTILWCVPRSGSTALTKCLSFIDGIETWFEPYCYCLIVSVLAQEKLNLHLPPVYEGNEKAFRQAADMFDEICHCRSTPERFSFSSTKNFLEGSSSTHVFVKDMADMAHTIDKNYDSIPDGYKHTFLIRHPLRVFSSLRNIAFEQLSTLGLLTGEAAMEETFDLPLHDPFMDPSGLMFKEMYDLWKLVGEKTGSSPIVIDGDDLMSNPDEILPKYCRAVGLPYNESLLTWDASTKRVHDWMLPAKGITKSFDYSYKRAVTSSKFFPPKPMPDRKHLTADVIRCVDQTMPYYNEMYIARIKI